MNQYVTGTMIKRLRETRKMTQLQLAERLSVSDKAISKWETGDSFSLRIQIPKLTLTILPNMNLEV